MKNLESSLSPTSERFRLDQKVDDPIKRTFLKYGLITIGFVFLIGTVVFSVVTLTLSFHEKKQTEFPSIKESVNTGTSYINRSVWQADKGRVGSKIARKNVPAKRAIVMHSLSEPCDPDFCKTTLTMRQHESFNLGYDDIHENFVIGTDGIVYEGRE